jgi:hypothetical protein
VAVVRLNPSTINFREVVPTQPVDATPSDLKDFSEGGL